MTDVKTNITERLIAGRQVTRVTHKEGESAKLGVLRAGSSGIMADNGDVAGTCHRKHHLRTLGVEIEDPTDDKLIMFQLGYASEDIIYKDLHLTMVEGESILREEEIPIEWMTSNGTKVTGRPDMVLLQAGKPILGLELKSVHSVWVARDVLFGGQPKLTNLIQSAHYMWKLDVPFRLIYKGYSSLGQGMSWSDKMASMFPREGEPGSQFMEYNDRGKPKQVKQFEVVYELEFNAQGQVQYRREGTKKWNVSLVNLSDIKRYYEFVSQMSVSKELGPRPLTLDAHGNKLNYTDCGYCPLQETCNKHESNGYSKWLTEVKKFSELKKSEHK